MTNVAQRRYIVRLHLNDREIAQWILDDRPLQVGRTPDNDIVIDNLAVSRHHATIEIGPEGPIIRDAGSVNGLELGGLRYSEVNIDDGLRVTIGKHVLSFEGESERLEFPAVVDQGGFDVTIQATATPRLANPAHLVEQRSGKEERHPIDTSVFMLGKNDAADVQLSGWFVADFHAEIKVANGEHRIVHTGGFRKVNVNGKSVSECVLHDGDTIKVAGREFRFHLPS